MRTIVTIFLLTGCFLASYAQPSPNIIIKGDTTDRHTMTFTIKGPSVSEAGKPNPFTDYKLIISFKYMLSGAEQYLVPGYYAADGNAGETGASSGNVWKAHFVPQWPGMHNYKVYFRTGPNVALTTDSLDGTPVAGIDGDTGSFDFAMEGRENPPDLKAVGRLDNDKFNNYMVFVKNGFSAKKIFLKTGAASPSNFLDYADFDNTPSGTYTKTFTSHVADWTSGDPVWGGGQKGKGIIGAINYLASKGVNTVSFNTLTIGGTDNSIFPYLLKDSLTRFDCSKLDQWQTVVSHANSKGVIIELRTQIAANDKLLDNGDLGPARKLYYRELIARFSGCLGIIWNLGDENSQSPAQRRATANYIREIDPYNHPSRPIILPVAEGTQAQAMQQLFTDSSWITGLSLQTNYSSVHAETKRLADTISVTSPDYGGKMRTITSDCQTPKASGVPVDGFTGTPSQDDIRKNVLWGNLMAKGAGVSYFFGSTADLSCQNFRSYDKLWDYSRFAENFFRNYLLENQYPDYPNKLVPMMSSDAMLSNAQGYCLSLDGYSPFVAYLSAGGNAKLDLTSSLSTDTLRVWWYNPRSGGVLQKGPVLIGGASVSLGNPPSDATSDWVALIVPHNISPDSGVAVGVRTAKMNSRSFAFGVRAITTHDGIVRLALPAAASKLVEIIASNGKVVATCKPNAGGKIEVRLQAHGVYHVSVKSASSRTVIARVLNL